MTTLIDLRRQTMTVTLHPDASDRPAARLVVRSLACRRGERILFDNFDLELRSGELVWLRAANGYGKTSLLRVIAGMAKPATGAIEWTGDARSLVYLAHANALKDDLTVLESVRFVVALHALAADERDVVEAIRLFGLHGRRNAPIRTLSQGQRRRVALSRLCLSAPQATWLLDEPFDALDADGVRLVDGLLAAHAARGGAALFTSHVAPGPAGVAPRVVQLDVAQAAEA